MTDHRAVLTVCDCGGPLTFFRNAVIGGWPKTVYKCGTCERLTFQDGHLERLVSSEPEASDESSNGPDSGGGQ